MRTRCLCLGGDTSWKLEVFCSKAETPPHLMLGLRFLGTWDSMSFADQKVERTPHPKLEVSFFLSYVYIAGFLQQFFHFQLGWWAGNISWALGVSVLVETPPEKLQVICVKVVTPPYLMLGLRVFWTQCHLLIKRQRTTPIKSWDLGFWDFSVTCWSNDGDKPHPKLGLKIIRLSVTCWSKGGDNPHPNLEPMFFGVMYI